MRVTSEKLKEINATYEYDRKGQGSKDMRFRLKDDSLKEESAIYRDNWYLCSLDEVDDIIRELQRMKSCVQFETGVMM